jgi:hypothetical protein
MGIVGTVYVWKDRRTAQERQMGIRGDVAVRVDPGRLYPAVPDIAVYVVGKERWKEYYHQTKDGSTA